MVAMVLIAIAAYLQQRNTTPEITSTSNFSVVDKNTFVTRMSASDADKGQQLTWSIIEGPDAEQFSITDSGELSFTVVPDFESPDDTDKDNEYTLTVAVTDSAGGRAIQWLSVTITEDLSDSRHKIEEAGGHFGAHQDFDEIKAIAFDKVPKDLLGLVPDMKRCGIEWLRIVADDALPTKSTKPNLILDELKRLDTLQRLELIGVGVSDLPIDELRFLRALTLVHCEVDKVTPGESLNLEALHLDDVVFPGLYWLQDEDEQACRAPFLKSIYARNTNIGILSVLDEHEHLELIDISDCRGPKKAKLTKMPNLHTLKLSVAGVTELTIEYCGKLEEIKCNSARKLKLTNLPSLQKVDLSRGEEDDAITDLEPSMIAALMTLDCRDCKLKDLSFLQQLQSLQTLKIGGPSDLDASDFAALRTLRNLRDLDLSGSAIRDLSPIHRLPELKRLSLQECNEIESGIPELASLLPELEYVNLRQCPHDESARTLIELAGIKVKH